MAEGDLITLVPATPGSAEEAYRVLCLDHPESRARLDRIVSSSAHAYNLEAKHLREYHNPVEEWPDLNLSAVASLVCMAATLDSTGYAEECATAVLGMWESLTGLPRAEAVALAQRVQASREPVTAAVAPF